MRFLRKVRRKTVIDSRVLRNFNKTSSVCTTLGKVTSLFVIVNKTTFDTLYEPRPRANANADGLQSLGNALSRQPVDPNLDVVYFLTAQCIAAQPNKVFASVKGSPCFTLLPQ